MSAELYDADDNLIATFPSGLMLFEEACQAGIYIIECDCLPHRYKLGWTRNINERLWHATYDFAGKRKRYAYALLFRFRDTSDETGSDPDVYLPPEDDELTWIRDQFETTVLNDTHEHHDADMGTEWRTLPLQECIEHVRAVARALVNEDTMPEEVQPEMLQAYNFQPNRLYNVCRRHTCTRLTSGFQKWNAYTKHPLTQRPPTEEQSSIVKKAYELYVQCKTICAMQLLWICGMGKTWFALLLLHELIMNRQAKTCVVAVPSLKLIAQWIPDIHMMFRVWYPNLNEMPILLIGSLNADTYEDDDYADIDPRHITTDVNQIQRFCEDKCRTAAYDRPAVILTTYHSAHKLVEATKAVSATANAHDFRFDVLVCDEAHHLTGITDRERVREFLQTHDIPHKCKLSMTATPKFFSVPDLPEHQTVYSMDNEDQFGAILDTKSLDWAIGKELVSDYRVCMIQKRLDTVVQWMSHLDPTEFSTNHTEKHICLAYASYITADVLLRGTHKKLLLYANRTEHADLACRYIHRFVELIRETNPDDKLVDDVHICSLHASSKDRRRQERKFERAHSGVICCVQIYGEGVNMPFLDGVVFGEPMESDIRIVQSGFRANRLDANNPQKVAAIIIPVLLPEDLRKQEGANAFMAVDGEYVNEAEQKTQTTLCKRLNFDTVQKVLQKFSQYDAALETRIEVKEANPLDPQQLQTDERVHERNTNAQALQNNELNEMVKNIAYKFICRRDLVPWTVALCVRRVKELSQTHNVEVYNEATFNELCEKMKECDGATTALPEQSPTRLFKPWEFAWQMVDPRSASYYATADECRRAVEAMDEDKFVELCEEEGIESSAYTTLVRVNDVYHEMDNRVPRGLSDRYYLREEGEAAVQYVVDGVDEMM